MSGIGTTTNALGWLFWALAAIAIALRVAGLRHRSDYLRLDDYIMFFSLLLNLLGITSGSVAISYGLGQHIADLEATNPELIADAGMWAVVSDAFNLFGDVVPKLAIALLVNRILNPRPAMKTFHVALTVTLILYTVATFLVSLLQCNPVAHQWNPEGVPGTCLDPDIFENIGIAEGALGSFVDLYFSLYPPIIIFQLQMATKKKIVTSITMSLGLFTLFTTLYKTAAVLPTLNKAQADITYILCQVVLWGLLESSVTIIAGSIPLWGWMLRTDTFERLAAWTSLRSSRFNRSPNVSSPRDEEDDVEMVDRPSLKESRKGPDSLDSIAELERSAARA